MKKNKVAIIGTVGLPAKYVGFETLAAHLVENLGNSWDFSVYCSSRQYKKEERVKTHKGAKLIYLPIQADGVQGLFYDTISIFHALFYADVLLVLGVSASFLIPLVRLFTNKKVISSVDGYSWKRTKCGKVAQLYRTMAEWIAVKFSHVNITNKESMQDFTALHYQAATNGSDANYQENEGKTVELLKDQLMDRPYAFKLCNIAPENNIEMILRSFVQTPQHQLIISGDWNNSAYGKSIRKSYDIFPNIHMLDLMTNQAELETLRRNSFAYIHGNHPGGIDAALLEAMFMGLPVLSLDTADNTTSTEGKAIYFGSADELATILNDTRIGEFERVGKAMQETAHRRYTWQMVATKYEYLFTNLLNKRDDEQPTDQTLEKFTKLSFDMSYNIKARNRKTAMVKHNWAAKPIYLSF